MSREATTWDAAGPASGPEDAACVVVVAGPERGVFDLARDVELGIGRSRSSGIRVDDPAVSRLHATLRWEGGPSARIVDHGSRNGTIVDGERVAGERTVRSGSEIAIGPARLLLVLPREGAHAGVDPPGDPAMRRAHLLAERAAACELPVLLVGETGVGKEVLARRIHARSARAQGPFVAVNCGSIPESLAETALFGHEKGSFTGAHARREGVFEAASSGTLLLDEIGELGIAMQVRLLRVLEENVITRVGGTASIPVDVRVLAATHRDLERMVQEGTFRRDLLYRLDVLRIAIPPLRERPADILAIAREVVRELAPGVTLTQAAQEILGAYGWPGNVRELRNAVSRALALRDHDRLDERDFAALLESGAASGALRGRIDDAERRAIAEALEACGGNQTRAAARLGISRRSIIYKMEKHGLKRSPR